MNKNTKEIIKLAKEKSRKTRGSVIKAIDKLKRDNKKITFASVATKANVSRNYLYKSEEFRPIIEELRGDSNRIHQSKDTRDLIIEQQQQKIAELTEVLKKYESFNELKLKYQKTLHELEKLQNEVKNNQ